VKSVGDKSARGEDVVTMKGTRHLQWRNLQWGHPETKEEIKSTIDVPVDGVHQDIEKNGAKPGKKREREKRTKFRNGKDSKDNAQGEKNKRSRRGGVCGGRKGRRWDILGMF